MSKPRPRPGGSWPQARSRPRGRADPVPRDAVSPRAWVTIEPLTGGRRTRAIRPGRAHAARCRKRRARAAARGVAWAACRLERPGDVWIALARASPRVSYRSESRLERVAVGLEDGREPRSPMRFLPVDGPGIDRTNAPPRTGSAGSSTTACSARAGRPWRERSFADERPRPWARRPAQTDIEQLVAIVRLARTGTRARWPASARLAREESGARRSRTTTLGHLEVEQTARRPTGSTSAGFLKWMSQPSPAVVRRKPAPRGSRSLRTSSRSPVAVDQIAFEPRPASRRESSRRPSEMTSDRATASAAAG